MCRSVSGAPGGLPLCAAGQTPAVVVSDLRSELVEKLEEGGELWTNARADDGGAAERSAAAARQIASDEKLGKIFKCSAGKIRQVYMERFAKN